MVARDEGTIKTMAEEGDATTATTKAQPVKDRPLPSLSSFDSDAEGAVKKKGSFMITNVRQGNSGDISLLEGAEEDDDAENDAETSTIAPNDDGKQTRFQLVNLRESSRGRWKCLDTIPETEPPPSANGRGSPIAATNGETTTTTTTITTTTTLNHPLAPSNGAPANGARALPSTDATNGGAGAPSLFIDDVSETISSAPVFSRQTSCESENSVVGVSVTTAAAAAATATATATVAASPSHRRDSGDASSVSFQGPSNDNLNELMDHMRTLVSSAIQERCATLSDENQRLRTENNSLRIELEKLKREMSGHSSSASSKDRKL